MSGGQAGMILLGIIVGLLVLWTFTGATSWGARRKRARHLHSSVWQLQQHRAQYSKAVSNQIGAGSFHRGYVSGCRSRRGDHRRAWSIGVFSGPA